MSSFKLNGVIKMIKPTQQVSEKFSKREFVVTDMSEAQYPQDIQMEFTQDKVALLDTFMEGQEVEVSFNLKGREWVSPTGDVKYFNTLQAFRLDKIGGMPAVSVSSTPAPVADDSLPF
jgi:hypothetical protein